VVVLKAFEAGASVLDNTELSARAVIPGPVVRLPATGGPGPRRARIAAVAC